VAERFFRKSKFALPFSGIVDVSVEENPILISVFPVPMPREGSLFKNFY
jgi:hypothetical protein